MWLLGNGSTHLERTKEAFVNAHHCAGVVEFSAVIRCAEQRHELPLGEEFITILDDLVRTAYQVHVVLLQEA